MKKRLGWSCFALVLPCLAYGQQQPLAADMAPRATPVTSSPAANAPVRSKLAEMLEARTRAAWAAFKKKDKDSYAKFLTEEFQAVEADGDGERTKAKVLREVEHSMYSDYLLQLFQVQPIDPDNAMLTYESSMRFPGRSAVRFKRIFISEWWTRRNGEWKMARYQETPVR
jgi:hypothetical protein